MKEKSILICCYAVFILIGGLMGYIMANSLPSLIASSIISIFLFCCSILIWKGSITAYHIATWIAVALLVFFSYRFFLTQKIVPAGLMAMISGCLAFYLALQRKKIMTKKKV